MTPFITHVQLRVADLDRSLAFYRDLLGMRVIRDRGAEVALAPPGLDAETLTLREARALKHRPRRPQTAGLYHVAWLLPTRADLGRALNGLVAARYPLTGAADHAVSESLYLDDPDGNGVEIYADRPRESWRWQNGLVHVTTDSLDVDAVRAAAASRATSPDAAGLLPAGTHIGHVHLVVSDLAAATTFWKDDVGLDVTIAWPVLIGLSHGGYHHHVNLNNWAGDQARADDPTVAGLDTVTLGGRTVGVGS